MASNLTPSQLSIKIVNTDNTELEFLGKWGDTWVIPPEGNILPNQTETYTLNGNSTANILLHIFIGPSAGIWYRAIDAISKDEMGFVNMSFRYSREYGVSAEGSHNVENRFISSGLQKYSKSSNPPCIEYQIGKGNKACWDSEDWDDGSTKCGQTEFYYARAWVRIHNAKNLDLTFDRYWNDYGNSAINWYWEPSSKDVPDRGNTRTVILKDNDRAGLTFWANCTGGIKFINLSFTCPKLVSNAAEGCRNDDRFISPGLQTYGKKDGPPVYFRYELGTPNYASWGSGTSTGSIVCPQTLYKPPFTYDRVFVMLGRVGAGKTSLSNLLLGAKNFLVKEYKCPHSVTTCLQSGHTVLPRDTVRRMNVPTDVKVKFKVTDQPGMGDVRYTIEEHSENLIECLRNLNVKTFPTFIIVINPELDRVSEDRFLVLTQLSELLMNSSYNLFSNAVVVFTHADKIGYDINDKEKLMQIKANGWHELPGLLEIVNDRYMFVNTRNTSSENRDLILGKLFLLSKPTLHIRFHGNNDFPSQFLKQKLAIPGDKLLEEPLYKLNLLFHPDLNVSHIDELREQGILLEKAIESMVALGEGVSAMVVLINLQGLFSSEMQSLILDLPNCYISEDERADQRVIQDWWKYVFIVFKVYDETTALQEIEESLKHNPAIKDLVNKAGNKWTWISQNTPMSVCRERLIETCLSVRKDHGGKVFIKDTVVRELRANMEKAKKYEGNSTITLFNQEFRDKLAKGAIQNDTIGSRDSIVMKLGSVPLGSKISVSSMRLILRGTLLSKRDIQRFSDKYTDPHEKVSIKEVLCFLANESPPNP